MAAGAHGGCSSMSTAMAASTPGGVDVLTWASFLFMKRAPAMVCGGNPISLSRV